MNVMYNVSISICISSIEGPGPVPGIRATENNDDKNERNKITIK